MDNNELMSSQKIFYWIYLAGFFLIILQMINVIPPWFTPTDWGKALISRSILAFLLLLFLWQILSKKIDVSDVKNKIKSVSSPFWLLVSLLGIFLLSTIFSQDPHFSLWGNPQRNGGVVNSFFYAVLAILAFLIIKKKDWKKIWIFSFFMGIIVSLVAIFQQLGLFSYYLVPSSFRPTSTMGNAILLSLYLALLTFISFSFGLKEKGRYKKTFYLFSSLFFFVVNVFLAQTRGTILGLGIGIVWFFFFYPGLKKKIKIYGLVFLIILLSLMYGSKLYLDSHLDVYKKIPSVASSSLDRTLSIFEGSKIMESRLSAWTVAIKGVKEKPILGWGPENFMIAFDKYYDPSLPLIGPDENGVTEAEWWDRGHSIIFDMSATTGIPSLLVYLAIFGAVILELRKAKKNPEISTISHGVQTTFASYLVALLFSFDSVSTYLTFFLLLGYSLYLISYSKEEKEPDTKARRIVDRIYPYRLIISAILTLLFLVFIYSDDIKPFLLNKEINIAEIYSQNNLCQDGLETIDKIADQIEGSTTDDYLNRKMMLVIYGCIRDQQKRDPALIDKAIKIMEETTNRHPAYLQNWILLGEFTNLLIEEENKKTDAVFVSNQKTEELKEKANAYFEKAQGLSPKRQIVLNNWADTKIITGEYEGAKEKLRECIELNQNYTPCIWKMALTEGYSGNIEGFGYFSKIAEEKGHNIGSEEALKQLVDMYIRVENYEKIAENYQKLIGITENKQQKAQLHASLAAAYVELGQIDNARKEAQKILDLIPFLPYSIQEGAKRDVEAFLNSLK